jgi:phosphoribosylformylglycinamidine synthase
VYFDRTYQGNPLVNAMCVGIVPIDKIIPARASGVGNPVMLVGAATGRDGIHGATFASVTDPNATQRSAVQVGNPFLEKLLMEACLELRDTGWLVGLQDLGAAGLTSSTVEAAHKGGCGLDIDVARAPRREAGMTPYEIMLSESQERMLVIAKNGHEQDIAKLFDKWNLHSTIIGEVIAEAVLRVRDNGAIVADIPTRYLTEDVPQYARDTAPNPRLADRWAFDPATLPPPTDLSATLLRMLGAPDIASRHTIYRAYDHMVGANTLIAPGADAAVLRLRDEADDDTGVSIAIATDGNGRLVYLDPYNGGALAVAEAARNCACAGAQPVAVTNCLNFGNPEKLEVYAQMAAAIDGMVAACRALETPVVSGNVSLYNETEGEAIYPSPVIGMVGMLQDRSPRPSAAGQPGDVLALLGPWRAEPADLAGSTYLATLHDIVAGRPPQLDLDLEARLQRLLWSEPSAALIQSAHDCSDGGLGVALGEWCVWSNLGLTGDANLNVSHPVATLFGEAPSRVVISVSPAHWDALMEQAAAANVPLTRLGVIGGARLVFGGADVAIGDLRAVWENGLTDALTR